MMMMTSGGGTGVEQRHGGSTSRTCMDVRSLPGSLLVPRMGGHAECAQAIAMGGAPVDDSNLPKATEPSMRPVRTMRCDAAGL